jgi:peptidyl-prolyl cis-trans isomerase C
MSKKPRIALTIGVCAAVAGLAAGCGGGGGSKSSSTSPNVSSSLGAGVAAVVAGQKITKDEVDTLLRQAKLRAKISGQTFPTPGTSQYRQLQDRAVLLLVQQDELRKKAQQLGVSVSDKQVEDALKQFKKQNFGGDEKRYQKELKREGFTDQQVRNDLEFRLLTQAIFAKITANVKVSQQDIQTYYLQHSQQYSTPKTRVVRHILVKTKAEAEKLAKKATKANFAKLAKQYSIDPGTKSLGGELTVTQGQFVKPFEDEAFALRTGQISAPVHSKYGWHVIYAVKPATPRQATPLNKVEAAIRQTMIANARNAAIQSWVKSLSQQFQKLTKYAEGYQPTSTTG